MLRKHAIQLCSHFVLLLLIAAVPGLASSAKFLPLDPNTVGNWAGVYGHDGYIIANDANTPPAYATVSSSGATPYTWVYPSVDARALLTAPTSSTRIASTFYTYTSCTFNINLTDGQTHQLALYLLDLDTTSRVETISILDAATNNVLDSRQLSSFHGGVYAVWDVQGHVIVQVTYDSGQNAVVGALFFDPASGGASSPPPVVSIASPAAGSVSGTVTISANATAAAGMSSVQFQLDGSNLGTAITGSGPYSISWDTTKATNASHALTAIATDTLNQKTTSTAVSVTVSNTTPPPAVSIASPTGGTVSGTVMVSANASAAAGMSSVQFQVDGSNLGAPVTGSGPYSISWDTTKATNASHTLTAIATDTLNHATTSTPVTVTVNNSSGGGPS
ncbi:MAG: Ig-like domain-containing protein, partial [Bryobacteraceae bacterium]